MCEPQLSKRNLYPTLSSNKIDLKSRKYLDFLQYADGKSSLKKISKETKIDLKQIIGILSTKKK